MYGLCSWICTSEIFNESISLIRVAVEYNCELPLFRFIVGWSLHNSLDASHCIEVLQNAIATYGSPEIINSDQGCQFTCKAWLDACAQHPQMRVSMDGRGRAKDNIWIERFWKTIKYEYIYILPEENGAALYSGIKRFIDNYNYHRRHQGIDRQVPSKLYIRPAA